VSLEVVEEEERNQKVVISIKQNTKHAARATQVERQVETKTYTRHRLIETGKQDVFESWDNRFFFVSGGVGTRVPGLPIRDCTRRYNNRGPMRPSLSATDVKKMTLFERLYLVLGLQKFVP